MRLACRVGPEAVGWRLVVREIVGRALVGVGLVAMVVGAVRDEGQVREVDLQLDRRQVVLVAESG